ncbi:MAG: hypothetical protein Q4G59_11515 [Planctomycetia bacterium]|nr:hypothetical protein [Planctomycetia bacterium]
MQSFGKYARYPEKDEHYNGQEFVLYLHDDPNYIYAKSRPENTSVFSHIVHT